MEKEKSSPDNSSLQTEDQKTTEIQEPTSDEIRNRLFQVIQENKKYREKNRGLEEKLTSLESQQMEEQGKYKDLAGSFKEKYEKEKEELNKLKNSYAFTTVANQVKLEAQKSGCKDVDVLVSFYNKKIREIPIDEQFQVDSSSLQELLSSAKNEKPYLFEKDAPKINDLVPKNGEQKTKKLSDMKTEDLYKALADVALKN